ncbi:MAG: Ig-like domain-containing protein, partial [Actinokineospora sp.]
MNAAAAALPPPGASDISPPTIAIAGPTSPTNQTQVALMGVLSEAASLTVDGSPVLVNPDLTFGFGPLALAEGANTFHLVATDPTGNVGIRDVTIVRDTVLPVLTFEVPTPGTLCTVTGQLLRLAWSDAGAGVDASSLSFTANQYGVVVDCESTSAGTDCVADVLPTGTVEITATVRDLASNVSAPASVTCLTDPSLAPPQITVFSPANGAVVNTPQVLVTGALSKPASLTIEGQAVPIASDLTFQAGPYALSPGANTFDLDALDSAGQSSHVTLAVTLDTSLPAAVELGLVTLTELAPGSHQLSGAAGAVDAPEPGTVVTVHNVTSGGRATIVPAADGSFQSTLVAFDGDTLRLTAQDAAGNASEPVELHVNGALPTPAVPSAVAPPLDPTIGLDACQLVSFFWTGAAKVQFGVQPEAVDCGRLAVIHGRVLDRAGAPLVGVRVQALDEPDYGATFSRADGELDFAVRANQRLVLSFVKPGLFTARRVVQLVPQQFTTLDDVVLVAPDSQVTTIDATGSAGLQVARGSVVTDAVGTRQTTVLFPAGTAASMRLPGGATQPLTSLQVRSTELTAGLPAKNALSATPPTEFETLFAVELTVDAAEALGASVDFSRPLPVYVENFMG